MITQIRLKIREHIHITFLNTSGGFVLFQTLDEKSDCLSVYIDGEMMPYIPVGISKTWNYSNFLAHEDVEYA